MKKRRRILAGVVALTSFLSAYASADTGQSSKYDRMYDKMVSNAEKGRSNEENYKMIEKILKKRNEELKDLYLQGDYIVKPEYLEWQVFFSGFYTEDSRTGSLSKSHRKNSSENWSGSDKDLAEISGYKEIKVGPSIPYKYLNLNDIIPNITLPIIEDVAPINLNKTPLVIDIPQLPALPNIQMNTVATTNVNDVTITKDVQINPISITVMPKTFTGITIPSPVLGVNGNGYYPSAETVNRFTNAETVGITTLTPGGITGLIQIIGVKNSSFSTGSTPPHVAGDLTYTISQNLETQQAGSRIMLIEAHRGSGIPASGGPGISTAGDLGDALFVKTTGTLNINADNSIGVEMEQGYSTSTRNDSVYINAGTITSNRTNVMGIDFKAGPNGPLYAENQGLITLSGDTSVAMKSSDVSNIRIGMVNASSGTITLSGSSSVGMAVTNGIFSATTTSTNNAPGGSYTTGIRQNGTINLSGNQNVGVVVSGVATFDSVTSLNNGTINLTGTGGAGIYSNYNSNFTNNGNIVISANANNTGVRVENGTFTNNYVAGKGISIITGASDGTGMAVLNSSSRGVNNGLITISATGGKNIGLYGANGGRIENSGANSEIKLDLSSGSENIGASVIGSSSSFINSGLVTLEDTNTTGKNIGIYVDSGTINQTGTISLDTHGNDVGIYLKSSANGTLGGNINMISSGNDYDYGIYYDTGYTGNMAAASVFSLTGKSAGIFSSVKDINLTGTINMTAASEDSVGILYEVTPSSPAGNVVTNNGTINASKGTGIYIYDGNTSAVKSVTNSSSKTINVSDGGVGIVVETKGAYTAGHDTQIINLGTILNNSNSSINNSIGIYAKNHDLDITGAGTIVVESPNKENLGIFVKGGTVDFKSNIILGNGGIGAYLDGNAANTNTSVFETGTLVNSITSTTNGIGVVSKGEKATVNILSNGINLAGHSALNAGSLGVFIEDSNINNAGTIETGDYGTAVYLKGNSAARNIALGGFKTGNNGVGIYLENQNIIDSISSITTGTNGIAVYSKNGDVDLNVLNSGLFTLGAGSTGYFLENSTLRTSLGTANVTLGNDITGVALTGSSVLDNSVTGITIGNNTGLPSGTKPIVLGIKDINTPLTISTKLTGGEGTVGLYYEEAGTGNVVTYNGAGSTTAPDIKVGVAGTPLSSVGVYLDANTGVNALDINNAYIQVNGKSGIVLGADTGNITVNGGKVELTEGGVLFLVKNGGSATISPSTIVITPDKGVELFRIIYSNYTNLSGTILEIPEESVAIHGETGIITNDGELVSKILSGTLAKSSIGMYIENTQESAPSILASSNMSSQGINKNKIDLGDKGIGIFGENSFIQNDSTGSIKTKSESAALYTTIGSIMENKGSIDVGENSVGMYALDRTGSPNYTNVTKENYLTNSGTVTSAGSNTVGISSTGADSLIRSEISNTGIVNLTGNSSVGIFGNKTNIINTGNITVGNGVVTGTNTDYAVGVIGTESNININSGLIQTGSHSIGAAATENADLTISGGTINVGDNSIYNYIKRGSGASVSLNDTSGGSYDLNKSRQIGIYSEDGNVTSNKTLMVRSGTDSTGVYVKNNGINNVNVQGLTVNVEDGQKGIFVKAVAGTGNKTLLNNIINTSGSSALGIVNQNGDIDNYGTVNVNGIKSVGILTSNSDNMNNNVLTNIGNIGVISDSGIAIYGTTQNGALQNIINTGNINLAASSSQNDVILGIYGEEGTEINNFGNINIGKNSIGLYGKNIYVNQNAGTMSIDEAGVGLYLYGGAGQVSNSILNIADGNGVGAYATGSANLLINSSNTINVGDITGALTGNALGSFGIVGKDNSTVINHSNLNVGLSSIGIYSENATIINVGNITALGGGANIKDGRVLLYGGKANIGNVGTQITNHGTLNAGDMGVAIYANTGTINNNGVIITGDTYKNPSNPQESQYAVGIYGAGTTSIVNDNNITFGKNGLGIYAYTPNGSVINNGVITSSSDNAVGIYAEKGDTITGVIQEVRNFGQINLYGDNSIGIAGVDNVKIVNEASGIIEVTGKNGIGIYADTNSVVENHGIVKATGQNGIGIALKNGSTLLNTGTININISNNGRAIVTDTAGKTTEMTGNYSETQDTGVMSPVDYVGSGPTYTKPSIINAGIIKVNERFEVPEDAIVQIKVDPSKLVPATMATSDYHPEDTAGKYLISNSVQFVAKDFVLRNVQVTTDFSQGTNLKTYKLEDVFVPLTPGGGVNYGKAGIKSKGIMWEAIPMTNSSGNTDIWMTKKDLQEFGDGLSWEELAKILDNNYENAIGDRLTLHDRLDKIEDEVSLRRIMTSLSGSFYANRVQRA